MPIGRIQTPARGILSFLGIVGDRGRTPDAMGDEILGTLDMADWYGQEFLSTEENTSVATHVSGNSTTVTVPAGERWRVLAGQCSIGLATGESAACNIQFRTQSGGGVRIANGPLTAFLAAGDVAAVGAIFPVPFIAPPGFRLVGGLNQASFAAPATLTARFLVQKYSA